MRSLKNDPNVVVTDLPNGKKTYHINIGKMSAREAERYMKDLRERIIETKV